MSNLTPNTIHKKATEIDSKWGQCIFTNKSTQNEFLDFYIKLHENIYSKIGFIPHVVGRKYGQNIEIKKQRFTISELQKLEDELLKLDTLENLKKEIDKAYKYLTKTINKEIKKNIDIFENILTN